MTDRFSTKKMPHRIGINSSLRTIRETVAITPPSMRLPVSPINTVAGKALYHRKPIVAPINAAQTITTSSELGIYRTFK